MWLKSWSMSLKEANFTIFENVGSGRTVRTGCHWFDPRARQLFFLRVDDSPNFDRIHSSLAAFQCLDNNCGKAASGLERILCRVLVKRTPGKFGEVPSLHLLPQYTAKNNAGIEIRSS